MKKLPAFFLCFLLGAQCAYADQTSGSGFAGKTRARDVSTETSAFNGNLSSADTTVQRALDTLDNGSGSAGSVTVADAAGDTTTFPMLATAATGTLTPATDPGLAYNATTNALELGGSQGGSISAAAGVVTLAGIGGAANNENLTFDFETTTDRILINSTSSGSPQFNVALRANSGFVNTDDNGLIIGSNSDSQLQWDGAETNDTLKLGLVVNTANNSGSFAIVEYADINTNFGYAQVADPHLIVQSSDAATVTDNVQIFHDQTNGNITTGGGNLNIAPAGGTTAHTGAITATTDITSSDTGDIGWSIVDQTDNQACTTGCTSGCVFGIENATGAAITGIVSCAATTSDLCACAGSS